MVAWLGSYGTSYFGEKAYPKPGAVIMQYTGLSEVTKHEHQLMNVWEQEMGLHRIIVFDLIFVRLKRTEQMQKFKYLMD